MNGTAGGAAVEWADVLPLEIRVLGAVEVAWKGKNIDIGGVKARALMARLLIDRGLVVPGAQLAYSLWGDNDGQGAEIALRSTISRVRKRVRDGGVACDLIVTRTPGYLLDVPAAVTDVHRFEELVTNGKQALGRRKPSEAARLLGEAEALWRGAAYSEVRDEPFARAEARRLEELRLSATESRMDAGLTMGRHQALVGELETLTSANPLRERLWSQRMMALYRSGRQAEALRVFQDLRRTLVADLGIEPGHDVTWLEHAILTQEPALDFPVPPEPAPATPANEPEPTPPRGYRVRVPTPPHASPFVGRDRESGVLRGWWNSVRGGDRRLLLIDGDPGIGKTRLVAELARDVEAEGVLVLWGRCDEDPVAPFQPFAEALGHFFGSVSADEISRIPDWRLEQLARLVLRLREYAPLSEEDNGDPEGDRYRFFEAVAASYNDLAADGTVLFVVDDLHRADQPTLLLLRHVLRSCADRALGVVGIYTDTEVPPDHRLRVSLAELRSIHTVEAVHLRGLSPAAVEELTQGWTHARADLVPELCRLTDGNPLLLEELLRQHRYRVDEDVEHCERPVPPDLTPTEAIRELVARRVSRLPENVIYLLQAAAVAGRECEAAIVGEAAELTPDQLLDAFDQAEESRLLRRIGDDVVERYAFSHALVRDAIYRELLRGRRVRYHQKIAVALERAHAEELDAYLNELAHHAFLGAAVGDAEKALGYCLAAGERALRQLAFEEAVGHFSRALELAERFVAQNRAVRCEALLALAEAQNRAGDTAEADANFARAAALARTMADAARLASAALRAGPPSYLGIVRANEEQVDLLEEVLTVLPAEDSHLRSMALARLGLVIVYSSGVPAAGALPRSLDLNGEAVSMARRLADLPALGYALNARMHSLWGTERAAERLATGMELGEIADDMGDELLALHGHMWRVRELIAQGDVEAVQSELARFSARESGPVHPLEASFAFNVAAMMALIAGEFDTAEPLARRGVEAAEGYSDLALTHYGALMLWTWWQRDELIASRDSLRAAIGESPPDYPTVRAARALVLAESAEPDRALKELRILETQGWATVAIDATEGVTLALASAACSVIGPAAAESAAGIYSGLRPHAGTTVVMRAPAAACVGPADQYLGLLAVVMDDLALAEVHFEASLRMARRMSSEPFIVAAEVELARTSRRRGRPGDAGRVALLLRRSEEAALRMGLVRLARLAADPG